MMINSINNISLPSTIDDDILRSLQVYHQLLAAVEPYNITDLERLDEYIAGLTLYDNFVNCDSADSANSPSRIYKSDKIIQYRLVNYIESRRKRKEEWNRHKYVVPVALPPVPFPFLEEATYSSLKTYVDYNVGRCGDIDNISYFEELFKHQDMIVQYQLHSDMLLLARIYLYINKKKGGVTYVDVE